MVLVRISEYKLVGQATSYTGDTPDQMKKFIASVRKYVSGDLSSRCHANHMTPFRRWGGVARPISK